MTIQSRKNLMVADQVQQWILPKPRGFIHYGKIPIPFCTEFLYFLCRQPSFFLTFTSVFFFFLSFSIHQLVLNTDRWKRSTNVTQIRIRWHNWSVRIRMFHIKNPSVIYVAYSHIGRPKNSIQKYGFVNNLHKFQYFIKLLLGYYSQFNYNA